MVFCLLSLPQIYIKLRILFVDHIFGLTRKLFDAHLTRSVTLERFGMMAVTSGIKNRRRQKALAYPVSVAVNLVGI